MKAVALWAVDEGARNAVSCESVDETATEQVLEDLLVQCPSLLGSGLQIVGRQTLTEGGPLDILAIDSDGRLLVVELKRGTLTRDAVTQVIDYASFLAELDIDTLASHIQER